MKVYRDRESGTPKGDGLVTYLKDPSVGYPPHMQTNVLHIVLPVACLDCRLEHTPVSATGYYLAAAYVALYLAYAHSMQEFVHHHAKASS